MRRPTSSRARELLLTIIATMAVVTLLPLDPVSSVVLAVLRGKLIA